jgi:tRNA (Thr-GGU) A37 N-methylase
VAFSQTITRICQVTQEFRLFPVGIVKKQGDSAAIVVYKEYEKALLGLHQFSHIVVLY